MLFSHKQPISLSCGFKKKSEQYKKKLKKRYYRLFYENKRNMFYFLGSFWIPSLTIKRVVVISRKENGRNSEDNIERERGSVGVTINNKWRQGNVNTEEAVGGETQREREREKGREGDQPAWPVLAPRKQMTSEQPPISWRNSERGC